MKPEDILLALGEIDETLPPECTKAVPKKASPWKGILAAAACIAVVIFSVAIVRNLNKSSLPVAEEPETAQGVFTESDTFSSSASLPENSEPTATSAAAAQPAHPESTSKTTQPSQMSSVTSFFTLFDPGSGTNLTTATTTSRFGKQEACDHEWIEATCSAPRTCKKCGLTIGSPNKHNFAPATCVKPQTCRNCGATVGSALGHDYDAQGRCKRCDPYYTNSEPTTSTTSNHAESTKTTAVSKPLSSSGSNEEPFEETSTREQVPGRTTPQITGSAGSAGSAGSSWDSLSTPRKYPEMMYNGKRYVPGNSVSEQPTGQSLGSVTLHGSDNKPEHDVTVELFSIPGTSTGTAVLVRFPNGSCYRYSVSE